MNLTHLIRSISIICTCSALCLCNISLVHAGTITIDALNSPIGDVFPPIGPPNLVEILAGAVVEGSVYGNDLSEPVTGNTINVSGGSIAGDVVGGSYIGNTTGSNSVNISGGAIGGSIIGSATASGHISESTEVHVSGGTIGGGAEPIKVLEIVTEDEEGKPVEESIEFHGGVLGAFTGAGNVTGNEITIEDDAAIEGGTTINTAYGGYTRLGNSIGNTINISSGTVGDAYSGFSELGDAGGNVFNFSGGTINNFAGGYTLLGESWGNQVNLTGETGTINGDVSGGYSFSAEGVARENIVSIDYGGASSGMISGGRSDFGDTTDNNVYLINGNVNGITGGYADHGRTTGNTVTITGGFAQTVYGGHTVDGIVENNTVLIDGATATVGTATGGFNELGNVLNNHVEIKNVKGVTSIYGGQANQGNVTENTITVTEGTFTGGTLTGGISMLSGNTTANRIEITGGSGVVDNAYGGSASDGNASGNEISITNSMLNISTATGGYSELGMSSSNKITVEGGRIGSAYGGASGFGDAALNRVDVISSTLAGGTIAGGYSSESGDALDNEVTIGSNSVGNAESIYGGWTKLGDAKANSVVIENSTADAGTVAGGFSESGAATGNDVTIDSGGTFANAYGGRAGYGDAISNSIEISDSKVGNVYGSYTAEIGDATGTVEVIRGQFSGGTVAGGFSAKYGDGNDNIVAITDVLAATGATNVYGGYAAVGTANDNSVTITGNPFSGGTIAGGYSESGTATANAVDIAGGTVRTVYGSYAGFGNASGTVEIANGQFSGGAVAGAYSAAEGNADGNSVRITDVRAAAGTTQVYGGYAAAGTANYNSVLIAGNAFSGGTIAGGYSESGTATGNAVSITGSTVRSVYGSYAGSGNANGAVEIANVQFSGGVVAGAYSAADGNADGNTVTITDVRAATGTTHVYGGYAAAGTANDNSVAITGNAFSGGTIAGGYGEFGTATGNTVDIADGTVRTVYGSYAGSGNAAGTVRITNGQFSGGTVAGAYSAAYGNANGNTVTLTNAVAAAGTTHVYGGYAAAGTANDNSVLITGNAFSGGTIAGGYSASGAARDNIVTIGNSGTFTNVYGGYAGNSDATGNTLELAGGRYSGTIAGGFSESGTATGNTVTIYESAILNAGVLLYGGFSGSGQDSRTGNTLNLRTPISVRGLDNFENYNFILPPYFAADDTFIAVTAGNGNGGPVHLNGAQVMVGMEEPNTNLSAGDSIILIDEKGGYGFDGNPANSASNGVSVGLLDYEFDLSVVENQLLANITGAQASPEATSLSEGFVSGVILANLGADAIAGPAMDSATASIHSGAKTGFGGFGSLVAGKSRYKTGSRVDMLGISAAAGLAYGLNYTERHITLGPFLEYGRGDYDTFSWVSDQEITSDGDAEYMGGGFLFRWDEKNAGWGRYFAEGSVRVGRLTNNFSSSNLLPTSEQPITYDSSALHYGMHFGYGGSWDLSPRVGFDVYGKYFWERGESNAVALSSGEPIDFDSVTSNRLRGGARFSFKAGDRTALYFGGAYEHQLDGWVEATVYSYTIEAPALSGGTGIGEFVMSYKPSASSQTSINIGVQGFGGKREGVAGNVFVKF
jgi:hypothetical protein